MRKTLTSKNFDEMVVGFIEETLREEGYKENFDKFLTICQHQTFVLYVVCLLLSA